MSVCMYLFSLCQVVLVCHVAKYVDISIFIRLCEYVNKRIRFVVDVLSEIRMWCRLLESVCGSSTTDNGKNIAQV